MSDIPPSSQAATRVLTDAERAQIAALLGIILKITYRRVPSRIEKRLLEIGDWTQPARSWVHRRVLMAIAEERVS